MKALLTIWHRFSPLFRAAAAAFLLFAIWGTTSAVPLSAQEEVLRIAAEKARELAIVKSSPEYPPMAKQMKISGRVVLDMFVGLDGAVEKVDVVSGNPMLASAAAAAAKKWKFPPFNADGKPMKAVARMSFDFNL